MSSEGISAGSRFFFLQREQKEGRPMWTCPQLLQIVWHGLSKAGAEKIGFLEQPI